MKKVNWGILGPGKIARKFAGDLVNIPGAKLHAVASRSMERAESFAREYKVTHAFGSYESLVNCPDLDVVYIASPHVGHYEHSLLFLNAGIAVLCEKPLGINAKQVEAMIAAAKQHNTFFMEALWTRFLPVTQKALEIIDKGTIGEVFSVKADFGFKAPFNPDSRLFANQLGGGSLLDIGIYPVFLALLVLGKPNEMQSYAHLGSTDVDEELASIWKYADGKMAQIHSTIRTQTKTEAFIYGTEGVIHIPTRWHECKKLTLLVDGERPQDFHFDYPEKGYRFEAEEVMRCLTEGQLESPEMSHEFSMDLIETLDKIRAQTGINYPDYD